MAETTRQSAKIADTLLDEQAGAGRCRVIVRCAASRGAGVASSDESCRTRVASRRTVLGWAATAVGLTVGVQVAHAPTAQAVAAPRSPLPAESAGARVDKAVDTKAPKNTVALTIDDGPHPTWTPMVLDLLAANGVHATFSLIGRQARAYPRCGAPLLVTTIGPVRVIGGAHRSRLAGIGSDRSCATTA